MTPRELYGRPPERVDFDMSVLKGFYFNHVPEIPFDLPMADPHHRVAIHYYKNFDFDGRRFWRLVGVHIDGAPVMILQNAGREGDDHSKRIITNAAGYAKLIGYLVTLGEAAPEKGTLYVKEDQEVADLTEFYGNSLDGHFQRYRH